MKGKRTRLCVATLRLKGASIGARSLMGGGNGHLPRLPITRLHIQIEVHISSFRYKQDTASLRESQLLFLLQ